MNMKADTLPNENSLSTKENRALTYEKQVGNIKENRYSDIR